MKADRSSFLSTFIGVCVFLTFSCFSAFQRRYNPAMQTRKHSTLLLCLVLVAGTAFTQTKRPLNHRDYDGWRTIGTPTLSRDGKFLAYGLFPEEGDGEVVVRNLTTNQEWREKAGERPQPAPPAPGAEEAAPVQRGVSIS